MNKNEYEVVVYCENVYRVYADTEEEAMKIARDVNNRTLDSVEFDYSDTCNLEYMYTDKVRVNGVSFSGNGR